MTFSPKVMFLRPRQIEAAANELLHKFGAWREAAVEPPIPIDEIIELYLELDFALADLSKLLGVPDVLGATWFDEKQIRVDERLEQKEGRLCFTMAHEVGHWVLHRPQYEAEKVTLPLFAKEEEARPPAIVCRSSQRKASAEWQADQFAANLLMPARLVRRGFQEAIGKEVDVITGDSALRRVASSVIDAGGFSNVSNEAMRIRLKTLNLVQDGNQRALSM